MLCNEIFHQALAVRETAETDLQKLRYAQRASDKFGNWLYRKNKDTPLGQIGMWNVRTAKGDELWLIRATEVGLPHQDLYIGIGWNPDRNLGGYVTTAQLNGQKYTLLVMMVRDDPNDKTGLFFDINWADFTHEFTHVMDYRRGYTRHKDNVTKSGRPPNPDRVAYYNSPIEFNAYYQQGLHEILYKLTRLTLQKQVDPDRFRDLTYQQFRTIYEICFHDIWLKNLNPQYRRKFDRRFYKFFRLVQNTWPNMDAIKDILKQNEEHALAA